MAMTVVQHVLSRLRDIGITDVEPSQLVGANYPSIYSTTVFGSATAAQLAALATSGKQKPLVDQVFGLFVQTSGINGGSVGLQVTSKTPPTFLFHTVEDTAVPIENSQMFYDALTQNHVPAKFVALESGGHGLNGYKGPMWDQWQTEFIAWLAAEKFIAPE